MPKIDAFKLDNFNIDGADSGSHFATGYANAPNSGSAIDFTRLDGTVDRRSFIEVSGLSFTPKVIRWSRGKLRDFYGYEFVGGMYSIYPFAGLTTTNYARVVATRGGGSYGSTIYPYKMTNMYVNETGFKVLVPEAHTTNVTVYEWAAWG